MKILHRIAFHADEDAIKELDRLQVKYNTRPAAPKWIWFDIAESDPVWPRLEPLLMVWGAMPSWVHTDFTTLEKRQADLLEMMSAWNWDYPKPEKDFGYMKVTYDASNYCRKCGTGAKQIAPFRFRGEPRWGRKHILQVNWVFDEYFVLPEVWEHLFKKHGVECLPVLKHQTGHPLESVVQLKIDTYATAPLKIGDAPYETCPVCHRVKYLPWCRGFFPPFATRQTADIFKTQEYFGSGGAADHGVIVSARLFREITDRRLKGVDFAPLQKVEDA